MNYSPGPVIAYMEQRPWIPIMACIAYVSLIIAGTKFMKSRPSLNLRKTLACWNFGLSAFSAIGVLRVAPALYHNLTTLSIKDNFCGNPESLYGSGSSGLWVQFFILSKFPELVDTFFIVVNKKPLIFLHWYHHITVMLYCWHSFVTTSPPGIFFVVMNYSVHSSMYGYYFLMAIRKRPKWFNPIIITTFQISQMVVGVIVTVVSFYFWKTEDESCHIQRENNTAAFLMYGSYLFLFMQFFIGRYYKGQKAKAAKLSSNPAMITKKIL